MKLEQIQEYVVPTIALAVGLGIALGCGYFIGQGDAKFAFTIIAAFLVICFLLLVQRRIWMLIPATWMLGGKVSALPIPFTVAHLCVLLAFGMYLTMMALKVVRFKPKKGIVDIGMLIMLAYVATVYVRNPVGTEALGSDRVGGRPYVDAIIAYLACWVLSRSTVSVREARFVPFIGIFGYGLVAMLNFIAFHFPSTIGPLSNLYSGLAAADSADAGTANLEEGSRVSYLQGLGQSLAGVACSIWRPLTVVNPLHIWRFLMFVVGCIAILLSGFRSNLMGIIEMFLLGSYLRGGLGEMLRGVGLGAGAIGALVLMQGNVIDLPFPAQRALSFLPGKWEYAAKAEAADSSEWRFEMWKAMLSGDKYIENKWLGDGFGFTHHQLEIMTANSMTGSNVDQQENLMISGGVHSGPVSTIRYVGYVGLALFLTLLILMARRALQLIRRAKDTPFFSLAIAFGMPVIVYPFNFVFIFGGFGEDLANAVFIIGLQRLLENSLDAYLPGVEKAASEVIQPPKFRPVPQFAGSGGR